METPLKRTVLHFFAIYLLFSSARARIIYCGGEGNYPLKIQESSFSPEMPSGGNPITFKFSAYSDQVIEGGTYHISVVYGQMVPVYFETANLCDKMTCPAISSFEISDTWNLPLITPPGIYKQTVTIKDQNENELSCFVMEFPVMW